MGREDAEVPGEEDRQRFDQSSQKKLRILFVTRKWRPAVGGMERYCEELAREFQQHAELELVTLPGREDGSTPSAGALVRFGAKSFIRTLMESRQYDVVHLGDMALWPLAMSVRAAAPQTIVSASAHGTDVAYPLRPGRRPKLYSRYLRAGARACPGLRVIANSEATGAFCRNAGFQDVMVLHPGVRPVERHDPTVGTVSRYLLFVGRLAARKGCSWFIREVLPHLPQDIRLVVAGTEWDRAESDALKDSRVKFVGPVFGTELSRLRRDALAVVMPNIRRGGADFEGFGLTAVEAASDGAVLLASRLDGVKDAVVDGVTGFLLPPEEPQAWLRKLEDVGAWSLTEREAFVERAVEVVRERYSWPQMARQLLDSYGLAKRPSAKAEPPAKPSQTLDGRTRPLAPWYSRSSQEGTAEASHTPRPH